jgi:F0F1-type ATP synthase delta subunit
MSGNTQLATVLQSSYVKADVLRRIRIIREYLEQRFFTPEGRHDLAEFLMSTNVSDDDKAIIDSWGKEYFNQFTKENAYELLAEMTEEVKNLPTINLYVPVGLPGEETGKLGTWVRQNVNPSVLIELHVDPGTFGGCAFAWNGVYYDYTLRHYMRKKMETIRKILTDYATPKS